MLQVGCPAVQVLAAIHPNLCPICRALPWWRRQGQHFCLQIAALSLHFRIRPMVENTFDASRNPRPAWRLVRVNDGCPFARVAGLHVLDTRWSMTWDLPMATAY